MAQLTSAIPAIPWHKHNLQTWFFGAGICFFYLDDLLVLVLLDLLEEPLLELLPGQPARAGQRVLVQHQVGVGPLPLGVHPVREGVHLKMTKMSIDGAE